MGYWYECKDLDDKYYRNEAEMARAHGVKPNTFNYRKLNGLPLEDCLKPCKNPFTNGDGYFEYNDKKYNSLRACCKQLEVPYSTIYHRIVVKGMSPKEALDMSLKG